MPLCGERPLCSMRSGLMIEPELGTRVAKLLKRHPAVISVTLTGSRARGEAGGLSDWDFEVATRDFRSVAEARPELVAPLAPLAQQWDRLSDHACYMLMLPGAVKVDLIFEEPHMPQPPWVVNSETLRRIDDHFWDWTIWLAAKEVAGKQRLVATELQKMHAHLLGPLGVGELPSSIDHAVAAYIPALHRAEERLAVLVPSVLQREVLDRLARYDCAF